VAHAAGVAAHEAGIAAHDEFRDDYVCGLVANRTQVELLMRGKGVRLDGRKYQSDPNGDDPGKPYAFISSMLSIE
jgi:hypothetical protein